MEVYELKIDDDNVDEVFAISLVENPAIELDFVYFNKEAIQFAAVNAEKRLVMGPILVPDKKIKRLDGENKMYEVFFKPETVKRLSEMYLEKKYTDKTTIEHTAPVSGVTLVESWIKESKLNDKSNMYGFNVPIGTWMGTFKITNEAIWQDFVKTGKVKGFSIEGLFSHSLVAASAVDLVLDKDIDDLDETELEIVLAKIKAMFETYADYGSGIRNNAKKGIELNEKNNNKCATQTGKVRAQQLANGEALSVETIKRMYSYLSRAETYYDENDMNACGTISYLLWGGKAALSWSRNKLRELGLLEETAETGPKGGIKESPKAPKSDTPNKEPKGEGTAKGDASGKSAKVTAEQEKTLQNKVDEFNKKESNTKNGNATLGQLKSVFQRGLGAFNTSHSPAVKSAEQWAYARVNAFLYLLKNGRPDNAKYTTDYDLLPKGHPKSNTNMEAQPSIVSTYPGEAVSGSISPAQLAGEKVSIDYDDTLSTIKGQALAQRLINTGFDVHIVTKRNSNYSAEVYQTAEKVGIAKDKVHFTNGQPKWRTLSRLGISRHYDNNPDEIKSIEDNTAGIRAIKFSTINDDSE
jgi:hypothetical protein